MFLGSSRSVQLWPLLKRVYRADNPKHIMKTYETQTKHTQKMSKGPKFHAFREDFLDVNALCAGSIAAITTGAAAIAPYGAAVHAACRYGHFLKTPKAVAQVNALWTAPAFDPLSGIARRLEEEPATPPLKESLAKLEANRNSLEELKKVTDVPKPGNTEADMETLLNLMGGEEKPRAAWPFEC